MNNFCKHWWALNSRLNIKCFGLLLYKYLPPARISVIENQLIRFSQPEELNDPIECLPEYQLDDIDSHIEKIIERNEAKFINKKKAIAQASLDLRADFKANPHKLTDMAIEAHKKHLNRLVGILSLGKNPKVKKMWELYTESNKGFVIGFDRSNEFFYPRNYDRPQCGEQLRVHYTDERFLVKIDAYELNIDLLTQKTPSWKYEEEIRIIRELIKADKRIAANPDLCLYEIPKEAFKVIIFGPDCKKVTIDKIVQIINSDTGYSQVRLKKAVIHKSGKITIKKYTHLIDY